jgi:hypothetical protein
MEQNCLPSPVHITTQLERLSFNLRLPEQLGPLYANKVKNCTNPELDSDVKVIVFDSIQRTRKHKHSADTTVLVEKDDHEQLKLPLNTDTDTNPHSSLSVSLPVFSVEQKQQIDDIMLVIHEQSDKQTEDDAQSTTVPTSSEKKYKLEELRRLCKKHKIPSVGNKNALFQRLKQQNFL